MTPYEPQTCVACLTPPGTGAIATLALRGPNAWQALRTLFRPASKQPLPDAIPESGRTWFGHFGQERLADEVVVAVKETAPQPWLEIHCHGGRQVVGWFTELLAQQGLTACSWQEFHRGIETPLRAAAREQLAQSTTVRTAAILLDQFHGALDNALGELRESLQVGDAPAALKQVDALLELAPLGMHLVEPWRVVVAGAPNVGKSSLVNALAGYQRSVVAAISGTTRDVVTARIAIDGWPVELTDTAGLRDSGNELEKAGMGLARESLSTADLCLWVVDATAEPIWPDSRLRDGKTSMISIVNKMDQPLVWNRTLAKGALFISALTGEGIPALCAAISRQLIPCPPPAGSAAPFLPPLIDALRACRPEIAAGGCAEALELLAGWT